MQTPLGRALNAGEKEFREIADYAPVMVWRSGDDRLCDWFNKPWLDFTGRGMEQEVGFGWAEGVHPADFDRCLAVYTEAFDARESFSMEYRLRRHDGEYRWLLDNGAPYFRDGQFAGFFGSCIDITAFKLAESAHQLLVNELNHRVKNTLAVVQSLARQSFRDIAASPAGEAFDSRLQALSKAHDLLTVRAWRDADLRDVAEQALRPLAGPARVGLQGPSLIIAPKTAVSLAMALHELGTNAVKYGALSNDDGRVELRWQIDGTAPSRRLRMLWQESGGPAVTPPQHSGFGMRMLERGLAAELSGLVRLHFEPKGLRCEIDTLLSHTAPTD